MPTYQKITVRSGWAVPVSANTGATVTINNTAGDTLYYLDSQQVSPTLNEGNLTAGQSVTLTPPAWMVSASSSDVSITYADSPLPGFEIPAAITSGAALGTTSEQSANKGAANGYASLDGTTKLTAAQVPLTVASGDSNYAQGAKLDVGPATPAPPAGTGEYIWLKTDGSGNLIDIVTGKV